MYGFVYFTADAVADTFIILIIRTQLGKRQQFGQSFAVTAFSYRVGQRKKMMQPFKQQYKASAYGFVLKSAYKRKAKLGRGYAPAVIRKLRSGSQKVDCIKPYRCRGCLLYTSIRKRSGFLRQRRKCYRGHKQRRSNKYVCRLDICRRCSGGG